MPACQRVLHLSALAPTNCAPRNLCFSSQERLLQCIVQVRDGNVEAGTSTPSRTGFAGAHDTTAASTMAPRPAAANIPAASTTMVSSAASTTVPSAACSTCDVGDSRRRTRIPAGETILVQFARAGLWRTYATLEYYYTRYYKWCKSFSVCSGHNIWYNNTPKSHLSSIINNDFVPMLFHLCHAQVINEAYNPRSQMNTECLIVATEETLPTAAQHQLVTGRI